MSQHVFNLVAEIIFSGVALLHAARLYCRWEVVITGKRIPFGMSWVGLAVAGYLAYAAHTF